MMDNPLDGVRLQRNDRKNNHAQNLEELVQGAEFPQITGYQIRDEKDQRISVFAVELPKGRHNQDFIKNLDLRDYNSQPDRLAFARIIEFASRVKPNLSTLEARQILDRDFYPMREKADFFNNKITARDLTNLPFISIDSDPVRNTDGSPLYGDYDDIFYITNTGEHLDCYVGFADITPYFNLDLTDPILRNAMRFGSTLYSGHGHLPMIGAETERKTSLLEGEERHAWILNFKLGLDGSINQQEAEFFRAKVINHQQLGFNNTSAAKDTEIKQTLANFRIAATIVQNINNPQFLDRFLYQKVDFDPDTAGLDKLVAAMMIFSRHTLGIMAVNKNIPVINRIQNKPSDIDLQDWARQVNNLGAICNESHLRSLHKIVQLIGSLANSRNPRQIEQAINMFNQLSGKAIYTDNPRIHSDLGLEPYLDIKGLRKLVGLVNQAIFHAYLDPSSASGHDLSIIPKIISVANKCKNRSNIDNSDFAFARARAA